MWMGGGTSSSLTRDIGRSILPDVPQPVFDRSDASLHLMFLGKAADVSLCAIEGVGLARVSFSFLHARPEILPPDYSLARMTEAAFHTNAVNT